VDLDQGGVSRQWRQVWMGPSLGWQPYPIQNLLPITTGGTFVIDPSFNMIEVNTSAPVTVVLPSCQLPAAGAQAQPLLFGLVPVTVVDTGGNAATYNITILPNNASETVMGLASVKIATNYGGFSLLPVPAQRTWASISP
jgi:hypothetical protein